MQHSYTPPDPADAHQAFGVVTNAQDFHVLPHFVEQAAGADRAEPAAGRA